MNIKTIIIWLAIIFSLVGLMAWGASNEVAPPSEKELKTKSELAASETFYDFGTISMANGNVTKKFNVINSTGKDILVSSLTTSCMCTFANILLPDGTKKGPFGMPAMGAVPKVNAAIKPGESFDVEAVYNPAAHGPAGVGPIDRFIYLKDDSGATITFEIKANVTP